MQYSILNAENSLPSTEELVELYDAVGWSAYTRAPERLVPMLDGSRYLYVARENTTEGAERLIGLVRAVGDGQTIAYVQDLLVHPQAQRHGIGSALLCWEKSSPILTGKASARGSSLQILWTHPSLNSTSASASLRCRITDA